MCATSVETNLKRNLKIQKETNMNEIIGTNTDLFSNVEENIRRLEALEVGQTMEISHIIRYDDPPETITTIKMVGEDTYFRTNNKNYMARNTKKNIIDTICNLEGDRIYLERHPREDRERSSSLDA